jgi:malate dehydrogenase (oxaloacetate-decarboxylating)
VSESVHQDVKTPQVVISDEEIFDAHVAGKLTVELKAPLDTQRALSVAYTPGVAQVSRAIAADHTVAARYTWANRLVAVSATAARYSASGTSVRPRRCP